MINKFLQTLSLDLLNSFLRTTFLNSIAKLNIKCLVLLSELNLPLLMLVCLWMLLRQLFLESESIKPWLWLRYIEDIFFVWVEEKDILVSFLERLNNFHPSLKFTYDLSTDKINFLDVTVKVEEGKISADLYCKPTDGHQYLHYQSCHPNHIKNSIVYSQALRMKRICTHKADLETHLLDLKTWFSKRGYPEKLVVEQIQRALKPTQNNNFGNNGTHSSKLPLVVTYHPKLANMSNKMRNHQRIFNFDEEVKKLFLDSFFVSFRSARNLKSHLVRSKVYPKERKVGSRKCGKASCRVCDNVQNSDIFKGKHDDKIYKINHWLTCDDKCLIYLLSCSVCGIQYIGQTTGKFRFRWNNYRDNARKALSGLAHVQTHIFQHFQTDSHHGFLEDCQITFIDKTDGSNPLRREKYWIRVLKTYSPLGLNISEVV